MMQIRPVSSPRNKYPEVERIVIEQQPVSLPQNGYGSMVALSQEKEAPLPETIEVELDEDDASAEHDPVRLIGEEVFETVRAHIRGKKKG